MIFCGNFWNLWKTCVEWFFSEMFVHFIFIISWKSLFISKSGFSSKENHFHHQIHMKQNQWTSCNDKCWPSLEKKKLHLLLIHVIWWRIVCVCMYETFQYTYKTLWNCRNSNFAVYLNYLSKEVFNGNAFATCNYREIFNLIQW